jgi:flagellar biosynthetic protein FlhB
LSTGLRHVTGMLDSLLWKGGALLLVVGLVDLARQHVRFNKDMKMSKQDVKDEVKESEGNPLNKARVRRIQRDAARRRMMSAVPTATAVIVNPTHYSVAIKYDHDGMATPLVVAKGKNYLAARIREIAVEHNVPLIENPPLARALYSSVNVGQEIPPHLYRTVAEILAYVYKLMRYAPRAAR